MRTLAVIGGGILGCLSALLAADRGWRVTVFERSSRLWSGASAANEGKIHLGHVYGLADDDTLRTMLAGAFSFAATVDRAVGAPVDWAGLRTERFDYGIMPDGLLDADGFDRHLARLERLAEGWGGPAAAYLGDEVGPLGRGRGSGSSGIPMVATAEVAIDPVRLGELVVDTMLAHTAITVRTDAEVRRYDADTGAVETAPGSEVFTAVLNAAWDRQQLLRGRDGEDKNYRVKAAAIVAGRAPGPPVTLVLGPYGDVVPLRDRTYASWYPLGRLSNDVGRSPDRGVPDAATALASAEQQVAHLIRLGLLPADSVVDHAVAGVIVADGAADIDRRGSRLHQRGLFGAQRTGRTVAPANYKFTTAPLAASTAVDAIEDLR